MDAKKETQVLQVRLPREIHAGLKKSAAKEERTLNSEIIMACRAWLASQAKK